jgi:hypothetical protein
MAPVTLVVDPTDSAVCATAVTKLACLPHGRVVCHPTPGGSPTWLGCDLLLALGKRFDALQAEHVRVQAWDLAAVWMRAEAIEHLFVLRAHTLKVGALKRLCRLQQRTGVRLWLVSSCGESTPAQRQVFRDVPPETLSSDECVRLWRHAARACCAAHFRTPAAAYPLVPMADFPIFRALCRRLLDPTSFAIVDRTFAAAMAETLTRLDSQRDTREHFHSLELELDELDAKIPRTQYVLDCQVRVHNELSRGWYDFQREAGNQLNALTASSGSVSETLVRLRAAQAAYFRFGLLLELHVTPQALHGATALAPTLIVSIADRLRGMCIPGLAAGAALALDLHLGPHALASLRVGDIAPSGTTLELRSGERRVLHTHFSALVRAQLIRRRDLGADDDDALFSRQDGTALSAASLRRLLQQVSRRLALAIPSTTSPAAASVSWELEHHLELSRLPVFPLRARQWSSV